ncbi:RHS repeat-associated core domain-containing protein [Cysteiniphilum sp. JM-1]|uniref:RHS repeat-associated core domain-containing protein n=1 Tax=Cysteiniphilum sp. JM-1 TaxID=2610891 RepID=UPI001243A6B0|nr:RHS repeat-associated core domain-containing protein [Cysteiniphilum sp. JM-1]
MKFRIQLIRKKSMISGALSVWLPYLIILGIIVSVESSFSKEVGINNNNAVNLYYVNNGKSNNLTLTQLTNGNTTVAIKGTTDYQAYGVHSDTLNTTVATNFSYNGEYQDPSSDLVYLRARDYDAGKQRFIAQDSANVWNKYNFADSNPIMNIDPSGHLSKEGWNTLIGITLIGLGLLIPLGAVAFTPVAEATVASAEATVASEEATDSYVAATEIASETAGASNESSETALANDSVTNSEEVLFKSQSTRYGIKSYPVTLVGNGIQALIQKKTMALNAYLEMGLEDIGGAFGTLGMIDPKWAKLFGAIDNGLEGVATALSAETVGGSSMLAGILGGSASGGISGFVGGFFVENMWKEGFLKYEVNVGTKFGASLAIFAARGEAMEVAREGVMSVLSWKNEMSFKNILISSGVTAVEGGVFTAAELNFHSLETVRSYAFTYNVGGAVFQVGIPFLI